MIPLGGTCDPTAQCGDAMCHLVGSHVPPSGITCARTRRMKTHTGGVPIQALEPAVSVPLMAEGVSSHGSSSSTLQEAQGFAL